MKKDIHPKYQEASITCACGNVIKTRSTVKEMHINTCSHCHPFYTGQATYIDSEGRVEHFLKRYGKREKTAK
jgi:large subunit ribosomal protein L31